MVKPFSWSWSRLKNYRTCPKRFWEIDLAKNFSEPESGPLKWGHEVHDAMAKRIGKGTPLPKTMQHFEEWPARFAKLKNIPGVEVLVENKLAMSEEFGPTDFFDRSTWFRGVIDALALILEHRIAIAIDWKTGEIKPDMEQLGLFAQLIFAHWEDIDAVATLYVWLGNDTHTLKVYSRNEMVPLWADVMPEVKVLAEAWRTTTYPPRPSGLCVRHCVVSSCPYHGKGSPR